MVARKVTNEQLQQALLETTSPTELAKRFDMTVRALQTRLRNIGVAPLAHRSDARNAPIFVRKPDGRLDVPISDGVVMIGSDCHYHPGAISTAHRAFVHLIPQLRPSVICLNGDVFDGARASRHPRIGWDVTPSVNDELKAVGERLSEIEAVANGARLVWPRGNHDMRFETLLAAQAPAFEGVRGFSLVDHFPQWAACWALWLSDEVVVKHRWRGGVHASYQNTLQSGVTIVTGHLHRLQTTVFSDYRGSRWGVDCGFMADPYGPQFAQYTELSPVNWASGFVVLTFRDGRLLYPELCHVVDEGVASFRGELLSV